jgi:6-phosphogluconolactonase
MSKSRGYFGTYTKKDSKGIYGFDFEEGKCSNISLVVEIENPTYLNIRGKEAFSITKENEVAGITYRIEVRNTFEDKKSITGNINFQ